MRRPAQRRVALLVGVMALVMSACAMTNQELASTMPAPSLRGEKVLLMPPDIECSELTTAGPARPNAQWNVQALQNVETGLERYFNDRDAELMVYRENDIPSAQLGTLRSSIALSKAVGLSILKFRLLPTKAGYFDWTLGPDAVAPLRQEFDANYAS